MRHLGDLIDTAYTINEANLTATLAVSGVLPRDGFKSVAPFVAEAARRCGIDARALRPVPARPSDEDPRHHARRRTSARATCSSPGRARFPVGVTLAMQDYQAVPGGEAQRDEARRELRPLSRRRRAPTTSSACRRTAAIASTPTARSARRPACRSLIMGYEFWPEALEATIRYASAVAPACRSTSPRTASAPPTTRSGIEYVRRALRRRGALPARRHRRARLLLLVADGQLRVALRLRAAVRPGRRRPRRRRCARPKPSADWLGAIARANAIDD